MSAPRDRSGFVSANGTEFTLGGELFRFVGAHTFPALTDQICFHNPSWHAGIDKYLASLEPLGVSVIRFFAAGPYNVRASRREEPDWQRLDHLVERCEARGVKILWCLWDYWNYDIAWPPGGLYRFWEDPLVERTLTTMVNNYRNSPAIFAWQLINEPDLHTINDDFDILFKWTREMSERVKALDPDHLVTTGYSGETIREWYFDRRELYTRIRDRLLEVYSLPTIDFATFHGYGGPADEMTSASWFGEEWRRQMTWYVDDSLAIGAEVDKPVIHEEWGFQRQLGEPLRTELYRFMMDLFLSRGVDNVFNGWGREYWFKLLLNPRHWPKVSRRYQPRSMLIDETDAEEGRIIADGNRRIGETKPTVPSTERDKEE